MVFIGKKGISVWVSYVLLTALMVSLGFMVLKWSRSTTTETVDDIVARGDALTVCGVTGIDISNLCQDAQTLNMDVTNTNDVKLEGLWAGLFDIYNMPQTSSRNITILPQETKSVKIIKQGIIKHAEITPAVKKDGKFIKCLSRKLTFDSINVCS